MNTKRINLLAIALACFSLSASAQEKPPVVSLSKPNIVLISSDDQAWTDYGFMGHPDIQIPHLDKLAASGLRFDRGYVAAPLCRPSLASMVTGQFPVMHEVTGNDVKDAASARAMSRTRPSWITSINCRSLSSC